MNLCDKATVETSIPVLVCEHNPSLKGPNLVLVDSATDKNSFEMNVEANASCPATCITIRLGRNSSP